MKGILRLDEIRAGDVLAAGGKGANLAELAAKGFPVPPAFVVSAQVSREAFDTLGLQDEIRALDGASGDDVARRLRRKIVETPMAAPLAEAILDAHARLVGDRGNVSCAVRSSATAEDLAGASFAGQHGTYYDVDRHRLLEMIRRCWASLWNPEAVRYRSTRGIPQESVSMAVIVQEMVRSEISGVAFTANPVNGDRREIAIESSWGMGAAIVDGRVTPDRFVVARDTLEIREQRIAVKRYMIPPRLVDGHHERLAPVPPELQRRETLLPDQIAMVASWSLKCEDHFGTPQDVEWAICDGRFHVLQSRPITTLERDATGEDVRGKYVLFKSIAENFTEPLTPLTEDLLSACIPPFIRMIGGRPYLELAYARLLIPFRISDEALADLLYLRALPSPLRWSPLKFPLLVMVGVLSYLALGVLFARTRGMPDDFMHGFRALCRAVDEDPRIGPLEAFKRLWLQPKLFEPVGHMVLLVNTTFVRFGPWMTVLEAMLRRWVVDMPPEALSLLCSGTAGVLSAEMGREIEALAREARRSPVVAQLFGRFPPEELLPRLREEPAARDVVARLDRFLAVHGHRAAREFELRSVRWEENPAPVLGMIRNYVVSRADAIVDHDKATHARAELEAVIRSVVESQPFERLLAFRWRLISAAAERVRYYLKLRENSRFYHIMALSSVRKKILRIEGDLLRNGSLKCREDIFFLRMNEISRLQAGRLQWAHVEGRIRARRLTHARLAKTTPPLTIGIEVTERGRSGSEPAGGDRLIGQCASAGRYVGVARVILDPTVECTLEPGEVLVAPYTDPAWTPLFLTAGAAVVEVGSFLSHAGTVAREYGMPCVVDVADCTRRIQTGMRVEVDAERGTVHILDGGRPA